MGLTKVEGGTAAITPEGRMHARAHVGGPNSVSKLHFTFSSFQPFFLSRPRSCNEEMN